MPKKLKQGLLLIAGISFVVLGAVGLALPFLQGFLFLAIGIALLSLWSPTLRARIHAHTIKYPKGHRVVERVEEWTKRVLGEQ